MPDNELHFKSLLEVARLLQSKRLSPLDLTRALLRRIEFLDPLLHSYLTVLSEGALRQAAAAEAEIMRGNYRGPLHGIPLGIKDLCSIKGVPTSCASTVLHEYIPDHDATVVAHLQDAGAVILGKLNMTEFAMLGYHPSLPVPVNPWNRERSTSGSSSGSGAATAAGLCFGSLGTDTGGSIRGPAAWCGLVGLKPTWGRVSRYGVFALGASLDHVGPITRSVGDAAALLQVLAGSDTHDPTALRAPVPNYRDGFDGDLDGLRIGIDEAYCNDVVMPDVAAAIATAALVFQKQGARLVPIKIERIDEASRAWPYLCAPEAVAAHKETYPAQKQEYGSSFRSFLALGHSMTAAEYAAAHDQRLQFAGALSAVFEDVDVILCPGVPSVAVPLETMPPDMEFSVDLWPFMRFSAPYNLSGSPTLSLPCGFSSDGLPIGMQLVARHLQEGLLLRVGHAFELATEWHTRHPELG